MSCTDTKKDTVEPMNHPTIRSFIVDCPRDELFLLIQLNVPACCFPSPTSITKYLASQVWLGRWDRSVVNDSHENMIERNVCPARSRRVTVSEHKSQNLLKVASSKGTRFTVIPHISH